MSGAPAAAGRLFDGVARDGSTELPVTLLLPHSVRLAARPGVVLRRDRALPESIVRCSVRCAPPERAVIDAMVEADDDREDVVVIDMAAAAEITSPHRVAVFLASDGRRASG